MVEKRKGASLAVAVFGSVVAAAGLWACSGCGGVGSGQGKTAERRWQEEQWDWEQTADEMVKRYEIAKRAGSAVESYLYAGYAASAYMAAGDEKNYLRWKEIEEKESAEVSAFLRGGGSAATGKPGNRPEPSLKASGQ